MRNLYLFRGIKPTIMVSILFQFVLILSNVNMIVMAQDAPPDQPFGYHVPFSAGYKHSKADIDRVFGSFPKEFTSTSAKNGLKNFNSAFSEAVDYMVDDDPNPYVLVYKGENPSLSYGGNGHWTCSSTQITTASVNVFNAKTQTSTRVLMDSFIPPLFCQQNVATWNPPKIDIKDSSFVPRWLKPGDSVFDKRSAIFLSRDPKRRGADEFGPEYQSSMDNLVYKPCTTTCDKGKVIKYTMNPGVYTLMLYFKMDAGNTCKSFKICVNPKNFLDDKAVPTCQDNGQFHVLLSAGIVVWANDELSSKIKLIPTRKSTIAIEFGFGVKEGATSKPEFYFGNMYRERVTSDAGGYKLGDAQQITLFFPTKDDCLMQKVGIDSENIESAKTLVDPKDDVSNGPKGKETGEKPVGEPTVVLNSTELPPVPELPLTTTVVPIIPWYQPFDMGDPKNNSSVYMDGKWWTWALYIGFVIGTVVAVLLGGAVLWLLRRTIYEFWYRGMFKRYGCDASGQTGGITGAGFGTTTAGIITVAGTTTAAGTTATYSGASTGLSTGGTSTGTMAL